MARDLRSFSNPEPVPADATLTKLFADAAERHGEAPALIRLAAESETSTLDYEAVFGLAKRVVSALAAYGLERGDRAAILSDNRPEWALADYGCLCAGIVAVPVYPSLTAPQTGYVLRDSGARLVFADSAGQAAKAVQASRELPSPVQVVCFEREGAELPEGVVSWEAFLGSGADRSDEEFREDVLRVRPSDVATMIYTSGTTGDPKGVVLTHRNLASNVIASAEAIRLGPGDVSISILPLSHVFQRMVDYLCFRAGCAIGYPRKVPDTIMEDLRTLKPTLVCAVPRIYERVHAGVMSATGAKGALVRWAVRVADRALERRLAGDKLRWPLALKYRIGDGLVYSKVRQAVGGRVRTFVSGGGPLAPELNRFFHSIGLTVLEGYGLTETSPVTNVNSRAHLRIGSVGRPVASTEIRIAADDEILVRGPQVMKGYHDRPEATAEAIDRDGWFHTGDIGRIDPDGFLYVTDRKKDLIVTAGGKNVAPQPVENLVKMNPFVEQAVMLGDRRPYCVMLVVPAFPALESWAAGQGLEWEDADELVRHPLVVEHMEREVESMCGDLAPFERPKRLALLSEELTMANDCLTPTMKVKRKVVMERMAELVDSVYSR